MTASVRSTRREAAQTGRLTAAALATVACQASRGVRATNDLLYQLPATGCAASSIGSSGFSVQPAMPLCRVAYAEVKRARNKRSADTTDGTRVCDATRNLGN